MTALGPFPAAVAPPPVVAGDLLTALHAHGQGEHAARVFCLTARVCRRMRITARPAGVIALAALFHDVGKLAIATEVLDRPAPLGPADVSLLRDHSALGEAILTGSGLHCVAPLVRHVHERWDGGGYPDGLAGAAIPRGSRVIAACDAWDAMVTGRPYQPARTYDEAIAELVAASGSQLEPEVVAALIVELARRG